MAPCPAPEQIMHDLDWCRTSQPIAGHKPCAPPAPDAVTVERVASIWHQRSSHRLGHYYEMLWQALLETQQHIELLACDFQLNAQGKTLGALDFLFWDCQRHCYTHLEVAMKFYLLTGATDNPMNWIGPNAKDRLGRKLDHMRHSQTQLLSEPDRKTLLNQLLIEPPSPALNQHNLERQLMMQGWLFTPLRNNASPTSVNHSHTGLWCRLSELPALAAQLPDRLVWLPKFYWIAGARGTVSGDTDEWRESIPEHPISIDTDTIARWHQAHPRAHLYQYGAGQDQQRLFIVPDNWPERNHADF